MPWASGDSLSPSILNLRGGGATLATGFSTDTLQGQSGLTVDVISDLSAQNTLAAQRVELGGAPSNISGLMSLRANSQQSDYFFFQDSVGLKSNFLLGLRTGDSNASFVDGLNLYDTSHSTMIVRFSADSVRFYPPIVAPVFDTGGALAGTYNAALYLRGSSRESQVQAAITAAAADGIPRVYVPANLYPYSAGSVSFDTRVQMVREGGNWAVFDIKAYGAGGSSNTHDSAAVQAASNGAADGAEVYFPPGVWLVSGVTSFGFANFQGSGRSTILYNTKSGTTTLTFRRHPTNTAYQNREGNLDGITVRDLVFTSDRSADVQGLWLERVDHALFENLTFQAINGPALHIAGACRENLFIGIITRWCGASAYTGALLFDDASSDGGSPEGSNANYFYGTQLIYSHGPALQMMTSASSYSYLENRIRKTNFIGYQFHGAVINAPNWNSAAPFVDSALTHSLVSLRAVNEIMFLGGSVTGSGQSAAFFDIHNGLSSVTSSGCTNITIRDTAFGGHTGTSAGTVTTVNSGVSIDKYCQVYLDNVDISNSPRDVVAVSGSSLHLGFNCTLNGVSSISSTAYEPSNKLTGVFSPRAAQNLFILGATRLQTQTLREDTGANPLRIDSGQDNVNNSFIIRTPNSGGSQALVDRFYIGSGSSLTIHMLSRASVDGVLNSQGVAVTDGTALAPVLQFTSEKSLGLYRSANSTLRLSYGTLSVGGNIFTDATITAAATIEATAAGFRAVSGTQVVPSFRYSSEDSLGLYRSGTSTVALSYGSFNLNQARLVSIRTQGSLDSTTLAQGELAISIAVASGASLALRSGNTIYYWTSSASTKG